MCYRERSQDYKQLEEEVTRLRHTNHVLSVLKLRVSSRNELAASLPAEILLMIFRYALPPRWMFSDAKSRLPCPTSSWSTDRRMKLSLLAVCKSWHGIGNELLYESAALHRITHLPLFVRALEGRAGLGSLVKHLDIDCFVPRGYPKLYEMESQRILKLCPNLSHIGFSPVFWIPENPCVFPTMNSSITSLQFGSDIPYSTILPALAQLCSSVKSLAITIPGADDQHPILTFDKLESLRLTLVWYSAPSTSNWRTPALRRLHLSREHLATYVAADAEQRRTEALLDAHGRTVTFLRLSQEYLLVQGYLDRCPVLEHLVFYHAPNSIAHRKVKFIDTFVSCEDAADDESSVWKAAFPSLRRYRRLDFGTGILRDVPLSFERDEMHPEEADDGETKRPTITAPENLPVLLGFSDGAVNGRLVHWVDNSDDYVFDADADDGGSVDSSDSEDSDSGSDAVTVSEDGGYLDDPFYEGDEWEIGRDEAIEIFDSMPGFWT